jgi:hypothetical protein
MINKKTSSGTNPREIDDKVEISDKPLLNPRSNGTTSRRSKKQALPVMRVNPSLGVYWLKKTRLILLQILPGALVGVGALPCVDALPLVVVVLVVIFIGSFLPLGGLSGARGGAAGLEIYSSAVHEKSDKRDRSGGETVNWVESSESSQIYVGADALAMKSPKIQSDLRTPLRFRLEPVRFNSNYDRMILIRILEL